MEFSYCDICTGKITTREMESPIEIMFYEEFKLHSELFKNKYSLCTFDLGSQYPVETEDKTYFVDFVLDVMRVDYNAKTSINDICTSYAIECDGHDFHEKTKEQVTHDKQRERILLNHFSKVIRFSGSEIYNNANKCVQEVLEIIRMDLRLDSHRFFEVPNPKQSAGGY